MMPAEKKLLLDFFSDSAHWCQHAEAQNSEGVPVNYDAPEATACDLSGAVCRLFGWDRAMKLFQQLDRHIHGKRPSVGWPPRDDTLAAMVALQDFNDRADMTFAEFRLHLESAPVWIGSKHLNRPVVTDDP